MPTGTLVHIFPNKKLMVKISEKTYDNLYNRLYKESEKKNYPTEYLAVFTKENDDGEDEHFVKLTPDKYGKLNMPMFERLLRKDIGFTTRMKFYDFMNDDNEQVCGINLEVTSIRQIKPKITIEWDQKTPNKDEILEMAARAVGVTLIKDSEIDEIADKAAARACSKETELNAEEQTIDEDVEKAAARYVAKKVRLSRLEQLDKELQELERQKVQKDELPLAPPVLERQSAMTHRRRRVQPSEESLAAADYQTPEEIKAFAVIDAFEQEE